MANITISRNVSLPNTMINASSLPNIKLTYFNLRARAEPARILLAYAGVSYQDNRLPPPWENIEAWAAQKNSYPYGCLPMLYWGEEEIAQSVAIARFLATKFGLIGRDNIETAQVDEIICALQDVINAGYAVLHEKDETRKTSLAEKHKDVTIPTVLKRLSNPVKLPAILSTACICRAKNRQDLMTVAGAERIITGTSAVTLGAAATHTRITRSVG